MRLAAPRWASPDERYSSWLRRYFDGDWLVKSGPRARLDGLLKRINTLTTEVVGCSLFGSESTESLTFPLAQNTHRYQDAHQVLYGMLIDGLEKECIGAKAGVSLTLHTAEDTAETLRFDRMARVVSRLSRVVQDLADPR